MDVNRCRTACAGFYMGGSTSGNRQNIVEIDGIVTAGRTWLLYCQIKPHSVIVLVSFISYDWKTWDCHKRGRDMVEI